MATPIPSALPRLLTPQEQEQQRLIAMAQAQQRQAQVQQPKAPSTGQQILGAVGNAAMNEGVNYAGNALAGTDAVPYASFVTTGLNAGNVLGSNMEGEDKAHAIRRMGEDAAASYFSGGIYPAVMAADQKLLGGTLGDVRNKLDAINPLNKVTDKLLGGALGGLGGGRSESHGMRSSFRQALKTNLPNFLDAGGNVTTANGGKFNIGIEGNEGRQRVAQILSTSDKGQQALSWAGPLAAIMTGGDASIGKTMKGAVGSYLATNLAAAAVSDAETMEGVRANVLNFIGNAGLTREDIHQGIFGLLRAGKITEQEAQVFGHDINVLFDGMSDKYITGAFTPGATAPKPVMGPNIDPGYAARPNIDPGSVASPGSMIMSQAKPLTPTLPVAQSRPMTPITPVPKVNLPIRR